MNRTHDTHSQMLSVNMQHMEMLGYDKTALNIFLK